MTSVLSQTAVGTLFKKNDRCSLFVRSTRHSDPSTSLSKLQVRSALLYEILVAVTCRLPPQFRLIDWILLKVMFEDFRLNLRVFPSKLLLVLIESTASLA